MYVGHPDRWKNGVRVKGAIFMSGAPAQVPGANAGGAGRGGPGGPGGGANAPQAGSTCGANGPGANDGRIAGPSGMAPGAPGGGRGGPGGPGGGAPGAGAPGGQGRGRGPALTPEQQAERDNFPGFSKTNVRIMLAWAELDPGIQNAQFAPGITALHDALCKTEGDKAKDGVGRCPVMHMGKGESHMSEVFSPDTNDKITTNAVLAFMKGGKK
jgi:hypothetical protein